MLKRLEILVRKFIQSNIVDVRSSILLRFAIFELCKSMLKDEKPEKFTFSKDGTVMPRRNVSKLLNEARELIAENIETSEKAEFIKKWTSSVISKITTKPMGSPFMDYLTSIGFTPEKFDVEFSKTKDIRDSITHGSTMEFSENDLLECNQMLYRISIGLILHQFELDNWIQDVEMSINE